MIVVAIEGVDMLAHVPCGEEFDSTPEAVLLRWPILNIRSYTAGVERDVQSPMTLSIWILERR